MKRCSKKTVLIAEDSETLIKVYELEFACSDCDIIISRNGDEVLTIAKEKKPDIIVLDMFLPGKNGSDVLNELKSDSETRKIPVMMLSNVDAEDGKAILMAGAVEFLVKANYSPDEIVTKIKNHL